MMRFVVVLLLAVAAVVCGSEQPVSSEVSATSPLPDEKCALLSEPVELTASDVARTSESIDLETIEHILFVEVGDVDAAVALASTGMSTDLLDLVGAGGLQAAQVSGEAVLLFFRTAEDLEFGACYFDEELRTRWSVLALRTAAVT